jgi:hypothetical protein
VGYEIKKGKIRGIKMAHLKFGGQNYTIKKLKGQNYTIKKLERPKM